MPRRPRCLLLLSLSLACVHQRPDDTDPPDLAPRTTAAGDTAPAMNVERPQAPADGSPSPVLLAMDEELARAMKALASDADPPPYFMAYSVAEIDALEISASDGALQESHRERARSLDVEVRVGSYELDNNRIFRRGMMYADAGLHDRHLGGTPVPIDDDPAAIKAQLWESTQQEYRWAAEMLAAAIAQKDVAVDEEDDSDDFSRETSLTHIEPIASLQADAGAWEPKLRAWSERLGRKPDVLGSEVRLVVHVENRWMATTEGTRVQTSTPRVRLLMTASAKADDGMDLMHADTLDVATVAELPADADVERRIDALASELSALRGAPLAEPYAGPAILEGRAAAVYFHEVFGHRVEGHRQKDESEGQTFAKKVGKRVMPAFIDVFDDPSIARLSGIDLAGHYFVDDEGVPAARADLVDDGVFVGFLMSRSPTRGFEHSNGHGRRQPGMRIAARQGNLVVAPHRGVPAQALTEALVERVREQGKPYGLRFVEIAGGFTLTSRYMPQAFQVNPILVYRVYPDGREELIRGAALEGTPLSSLEEIVAAGDEYEVFNGVCGAESGWVPVSAASPDLLLDRIEVARAPKSQDKPPLLPPPSPSVSTADPFRGAR